MQQNRMLLNHLLFIYLFLSGQNLRNEEQVAIIQASTVLSLAEKVNAETFKLSQLLIIKDLPIIVFFWLNFPCKSVSSGLLG